MFLSTLIGNNTTWAEETEVTTRNKSEGFTEKSLENIKTTDKSTAETFKNKFKGKDIKPPNKNFMQISEEKWANFLPDFGDIDGNTQSPSKESLQLRWEFDKKNKISAAEYPLRAAGKLSKKSGKGGNNNGNDKPKPEKFDVWRLALTTTIPTVQIVPWITKCIESNDSNKYIVQINPEIEPDSYKWLIEGAFLKKAVFPIYKRQNRPTLEYSTPEKKTTIIKKARWFAKDENRLASKNGPRAGYRINCEIIINGDKWILIKDNFKRANPQIIKLPFTTSQFYDKTLAHEQYHVKQWKEIVPWKNLYNVEKWWNDEFCNMEGNTKLELQNKFTTKLIELYEYDRATFKNKEVEMELSAWHISNKRLPNYLEMTDKEIISFYGEKK